MRKILIIFISSFFISLPVFADDLSKKLSEYVSGLFGSILPGQGQTEISIDIRENYKPDYSVLFVRELMEDDNGNFFTQLSIINTEKLNSETIVANFGLGKRMLSDDKLFMTGFNAFLDADEDGNLRSSIGVELKNAVLGFGTNYYTGLKDASGEKVLDGYDVELNSQIPYLHWAKAFVNVYEWEGVDRDDIKGNKIGTEMQLTPTFSLEAAYDDKDKKGLNDEFFVNLLFNFPPKKSPSLTVNGISNAAWKEERNMSGELLSKVERQNKIFVEFKGASTISRSD